MNLSTNLYNFELVYSFEGLIKEFLMGIPLRQLELISSSGVDQASRQGKQISAQSMQGGRVPFLRQAQPFEPVDQIVSQQNQMKMDLIGQKTVGGNVAKRKTFFEFSDVQFAAGSGFVKMPHVFRTQQKIGNEGMVKVILEFPESELIVLFLGFWFGSAHYNKSMRPLPIVRLVSKLSCLPASLSEGAVTKVLSSFLNRLGHFGHDRVTSLFLVEWFDEFVVEESRVGANPDAIEVFGNSLSAGRPERLGSSCRMSIPWAQKPMPGISRMCLEANQRVIAGASRLLRVVADLGSSDIPAEDRQDCRIQIEDKTAGRMRPVQDFSAQQVVRTDNALRLRQTDSLQEFSQGGRLGKLLQSQQFLETAVVLDRPGVEDTAHSCDHRINHALQEFDRMIDTASSLPAGMSLQDPFEIQFSTKPLKKRHTAEMREGGILEGEYDFSDTFSHYTETILLVMFPRHKYSCSDYSVSSSVMPTFLFVFCGDSPFFQVELLLAVLYYPL